MKIAIRYVIVFLIGFLTASIASEAGLTRTETGEMRVCAFVILLLVLIFGGGWLDRRYLKKSAPSQEGFMADGSPLNSRVLLRAS